MVYVLRFLVKSHRIVPKFVSVTTAATVTTVFVCLCIESWAVGLSDTLGIRAGHAYG